MLSLIERNKSKNIFCYFFTCFFTIEIPSVLLGFVAAIIWGQGPSIYVGNDTSNYIWQFFIVGIIIPLLESAVLIYPTVVASSAIKSRYLAALIGAIWIIGLHAFDQWNKPFVIAWSFYIQALAYIELKKSGTSAMKSFVFVFLIHAINNSIILAISYI